jgi:hypothetical protein
VLAALTKHPAINYYLEADHMKDQYEQVDVQELTALTKHPAINYFPEGDQLCWRLSPNILQLVIIMRLIR